MHADYNERQYLLDPDDGDSYLSSTSINGWEWWKPFVASLDVTIGVLLAMWAGLVIVFTFMKKSKKAVTYVDVGKGIDSDVK